MRTIGLACALIGSLLTTSMAAAQSRSAMRPSASRPPTCAAARAPFIPITGSLRQGMPVKILREEDGWLAITPPTGSSSWIQDRQVKHYPARGGQRAYLVVLGDNVPTDLGTPKIQAARNPHWQPEPRHDPLSDRREDHLQASEWWRIEPASGEVRYVARSASRCRTHSVVALRPIQRTRR